jgi:2-keto-3-deoxy-L-rhamnonate aldolase RhmA
MPEPRSLAERMRDGDCVYGPFVFSPDPAHTELAGIAGFDFVIVDLEHAPLGISDVLAHVRAAASASLSVIVRVADAAPAEAARLLDIGVTGIVFPHVGLAPEQTAAAVSALRYGPEGTRPACTGVRAGGYGQKEFSDYVRRAYDTTLAIGLIEDAAVVDRIGEVLGSVALDVVLPGPGDLAASLGLPGALSHPRVRAEVDRIVDAAQSRGLAVGAYVGSVEDALAWRKRGATFIAYSIDYKIVGAAFREIRSALAR